MGAALLSGSVVHLGRMKTALTADGGRGQRSDGMGSVLWCEGQSLPGASGTANYFRADGGWDRGSHALLSAFLRCEL